MFDPDELKRAFPKVYCDHCEAIQPMIFDVMDNGKQVAADIMCDVCASIVATLHTGK